MLIISSIAPQINTFHHFNEKNFELFFKTGNQPLKYIGNTGIIALPEGKRRTRRIEKV